LGTYTLGEIAAHLGGSVRGDAGRTIAGIKPLDQAGPEDLSFVAHPRYIRAAAASRAGALLARVADAPAGRDLIIVDNPYAALAEAMGLFFAPERHAACISPQAEIGEGTTLGEGLSIGPFAVVGRGCRLHDRAVLMAGVVLGDQVEIGADTVLHPGVVVYSRTVIGARVTVHASSVLGSDGFGYAEADGSRPKIPQVGNLIVEDDVEIGAGTTIDRATFGSTVIGRGTRIDNLVQIGHNVQIGDGSVLVAQSGVAGSTRLGRSVVMAGQSGAAGHLVLDDRSLVGAKSAVLGDLPPDSFVVGHPAVDHRVWKRAQAVWSRLPDLLLRIRRLETALGARRRGGARSTERRGTVPGTGRRRRKNAG
jgi:UDP-3-O-[3-hydroxymyristoyl] glucosamine N-acyltransferase